MTEGKMEWNQCECGKGFEAECHECGKDLCTECAVKGKTLAGKECHRCKECDIAWSDHLAKLADYRSILDTFRRGIR